LPGSEPIFSKFASETHFQAKQTAQFAWQIGKQNSNQLHKKHGSKALAPSP
jgi:hypothetical protein